MLCRGSDTLGQLGSLAQIAVRRQRQQALLGIVRNRQLADEGVQIYGGNGFTEDYPVEGVYRDCRVNRIFEGTNEINRLLIPGQLLRRAMKGEIGLFAAAKQLQDELLSGPSFDDSETDAPLAAELKVVSNAKKIALMVLGAAAQKFMAAIQEQQMVLSWAADIIIEAFLMESAVARTVKMVNKDGAERSTAAIDATQLFVHDSINRIELSARNALAAISTGDDLRMMLAVLKRLTKHEPINTAAVRERIADRVVAAGGYLFQ